jgi:hypothetical protein
MSSAAEANPARPGPDRRRRNLKGSVKGLFLARRRTRRRSTDAHVTIDHFRARNLLWAFGIPLFSAIDCFWTLTILGAGGREVNPVMRSLIDYDISAFVVVKMLLTSVCVLVLLAYGHFSLARHVRVTHIMYALLMAYAALFAYELHLIGLLHPPSALQH